MNRKLLSRLAAFVLPVIVCAIALPVTAEFFGAFSKTRVFAFPEEEFPEDPGFEDPEDPEDPEYPDPEEPDFGDPEPEDPEDPEDPYDPDEPDDQYLATGENAVRLMAHSYAYCYFTPQETGYYQFLSIGDLSMSTELYDPWGSFDKDCSSNGNENFLFVAKLEGNQEYCLDCYWYGTGDTMISVQITKINLSGSCGANATWSLNLEGVLTINGSGDMKDYGYNLDEDCTYVAPWKDVCSDITSVVIADGITRIGNEAFEDCRNLQSVTIPQSVRSIGRFAFHNCSNLKAAVLNAGLESIENSAFYGCENLNSISIPDSVTNLEEYAFSRCSEQRSGQYGPKSLTIGSGITEIPKGAFSGCKALTDVTIRGAVTSIDESAFSNCSSLTAFVIPEMTVNVGDYAFCGCSSLVEVAIPNGVTYIGVSAFTDCRSLISVSIPESVEVIGEYAFNSCSNLKSVTIAGTDTSIGQCAFFYCYALEDLTLSEGVKSIGDSAFSQCISLKTLTVPKSVDSIGTLAFNGCTGLTSVTIFGGGTTTIGDSAFYYCSQLTDLTIGEGVTAIGEEAFRGCSKLVTVTISSTVSEIKEGAFYGCYAVTDVYCYADPTGLTWEDSTSNDFVSGYYLNNYPKTVCHVYADKLESFQTNFPHVNVEFKGDLLLNEALYGYTVCLEGSIGVNFFMQLDQMIVDNDEAYMEFHVPSGNKTEIQRVYMKDVREHTGWLTTEPDKIYYLFDCTVSAKDAASTITAQMVCGEMRGTVYTFSVRDYAAYLLKQVGDGPVYESLQSLLKALMSYCTCAQNYFGTNTATLDTSYIDQAALNQVTAESMVAAKDVPDTSIDIANLSGVAFEGATLSLKAETTLSLYFSSADDLTFTCDKRGVTIVSDFVGNYKVVRIRGINATRIGDSFTVTIGNSSGESGTVTYSVLNYCYNVLSGNYDADLKNVVKSLYIYYKAADQLMSEIG